MPKFTIQMDFEGMEDDLSEFDGMTIEADNEDDADIKVMDMIEKKQINLPFFAITESED
ncbi:MAG: hypothetical protein Tp1124SUR1240571_32 [Prokaryotic dsDNA virus sp.]|nr:MAG: hypothetical protein Tp1124SUR1240571_32 [Prokaryotic dsDNA virus sp.]|tara:strand:+ start:313 stop:489 length:177 start_codon:yes stop_codon:yes gene_type:complete